MFFYWQDYFLGLYYKCDKRVTFGGHMPKETFINLKPHKKEKLMQAMTKELSIHTFEHLSIANIVRDAEIPRGSFYQYFEDKEDLYQYYFSHIASLKMDYFKDIFMSSTMTFFERIATLFKQGLVFKKKYPELVEVAKKMYESDYYKDLLIKGGWENKVVDTYEVWIKQDQQLGIIRETIDSKMLSELINEMTTRISLDSFIYDKYDESVWEHKLDEMLDILKKGILNHV